MITILSSLLIFPKPWFGEIANSAKSFEKFLLSIVYIFAFYKQSHMYGPLIFVIYMGEVLAIRHYRISRARHLDMLDLLSKK